MPSNSLWNPFLFSVFRDPRTFKNDDDGGGNDECTVKVNVGQVPGPLVLKPTLFRCVSCSHL